MGTVTAIIPVYNGAAFLREALDSVFAQTRKADEVIVVDDGSTDDSAAIAASYPGVTLLQQANEGVSTARNRAIEMAKSEWIAFLDQDDVWLPEKLAEQIASLETDTADVSVCNVRNFTGALSSPVWAEDRQLPPTHKIAGYLRGYLRFPPSAVVAHRSALLAVGGFESTSQPCEDWDLWLRLAAANFRFVRTDGHLLYIRTHGANESRKSYKMYDGEMRAWDRRIGPTISLAARPLARLAARSHFLAGVALMEREQQRPHLAVMAKSLALWPVGEWRRHKIFAHMVLNKLHLVG